MVTQFQFGVNWKSTREPTGILIGKRRGWNQSLVVPSWILVYSQNGLWFVPTADFSLSLPTVIWANRMTVSKEWLPSAECINIKLHFSHRYPLEHSLKQINQHCQQHFNAELRIVRSGASRISQRGHEQPIIWPIFPENYMKMKKF